MKTVCIVGGKNRWLFMDIFNLQKWPSCEWQYKIVLAFTLMHCWYVCWSWVETGKLLFWQFCEHVFTANMRARSLKTFKIRHSTLFTRSQNSVRNNRKNMNSVFTHHQLDLTPGCDKFFSRGSPMGQPRTVNQLSDRAQLLNPKFYHNVEKLLVKPDNISLWDILPTNEVKRSHLQPVLKYNVIHIW